MIENKIMPFCRKHSDLVDELPVLLLGHDGVAEREQPEELHRVAFSRVDLKKRINFINEK